MQIKKNLLIQQDVAKVFAFLVDFKLSGLWNSLVIAPEPLDQSQIEPKLGYCYKHKIKLLNRQWDVSYQIIEFELNHLLTSKSTSGWLPGIVSYRLEQIGQTTRLIYQYEFELLKFFKPFETLLQKNLDRQTEIDLENLKDWLESGLYTSNFSSI